MESADGPIGARGSDRSEEVSSTMCCNDGSLQNTSTPQDGSVEAPCPPEASRSEASPSFNDMNATVDCSQEGLRRRGAPMGSAVDDGNARSHHSISSVPCGKHDDYEDELTDTMPLSWLPGWLKSVIVLFVVVTVVAVMRLGDSFDFRFVAQQSAVSSMLNVETVHAVGVAVSNMSRSLRFYTEILGGHELDPKNMAKTWPRSWGTSTFPPLSWPGLGRDQFFSDGQSDVESPWRLVNYGSTHVVLWRNMAADEAVPSDTQLTPSGSASSLAFRVAQIADVDDIAAALDQLLAGRHDLGDARCEARGRGEGGQDKIIANADNGHWRVLFCRGPDKESIQFWQPTQKLASVMERARKKWARVARDSKGRDLFE